MRKSIWIAVALCAAVFALLVLAGCDNGEVTDEEIAGNGSTSGNNGGTSQGGMSGGGDTGNTGNTGDSGNGSTMGGNSDTSGNNGGTSQGGASSGGDTGNTGSTGDTGDSGNGNTSGGDSSVSGNGGAGENLFKGKTLVYEDTERRDNDDGSWVEYYDYISMTFTTDTTGEYLSKWRETSSSHKYDEEETEYFPFTYSLGSANGKNFLHVLLSVLNDEEIEHFLQEYEGVSEKTKELLVERELTEFLYYEFGENDMVKINEHYYAGNIAKSRSGFTNDYFINTNATEYVKVYFRNKFLSLDWNKKVSDKNSGSVEEKRYWGIPEFNGKDFTVEMYSVAGREDECSYTPIGTLKGKYTTKGMGNCEGTITFTELPGEMNGLFEKSYQIQNWNPDDDKHNMENYWGDWVVMDTE